MDYLMGIDLGSTSLKAIVYDLRGNVVAGASCPTERHNPYPDHPEWTVWLPQQIWGGTAEAIREAMSKLDDPGSVRAVAVTGMGGDGVPIDEQGHWLYPFISWLDPRVEPQHRWWLEHIGGRRQFQRGGNQVFMYNTALRLRWMMENEPEILRRTYKWLLIEDFLNFMLCGAIATDYSMASSTLLLDQTTLNWSEELLSLSGIERRLLGDPKPSGTYLGGVTAAAAKATGLAEGTPVILGGHDYLCGALPAGAFEPGVVLDVTGTWEIVLTPVPKPILTEQAYRSALLVESHVARGMYSAMGSAVAADMLEWFRNEFCLADRLRAEKEGLAEWACIRQTAESTPPGAKGIMFLPHMASASCPVPDPRSLGVFAGLSSITRRGDMLRAIIEGLDYQFREIVEALKTGLDATPTKIVAVGGAIKNPFWMQNKADVVGMPIDVPDLEEATPLGAAIVAGIGIGLYADERDAYERTYRPGRIYEPNDSLVPKYERWYGIYKQLYPATKGINHQLFDTFAG